MEQNRTGAILNHVRFLKPEEQVEIFFLGFSFRNELIVNNIIQDLSETATQAIKDSQNALGSRTYYSNEACHWENLELMKYLNEKNFLIDVERCIIYASEKSLINFLDYFYETKINNRYLHREYHDSFNVYNPLYEAIINRRDDVIRWFWQHPIVPESLNRHIISVTKSTMLKAYSMIESEEGIQWAFANEPESTSLETVKSTIDFLLQRGYPERGKKIFLHLSNKDRLHILRNLSPFLSISINSNWAYYCDEEEPDSFIIESPLRVGPKKAGFLRFLKTKFGKSQK